MIIPDRLVDELWFSDPSTNLFRTIQNPRKSLDPRTRGIYADRLKSANQKVRYAADSLVRLLKIIDDLGSGEFIYFDDLCRLQAHAAMESFLIFARATLDLVSAAWWAYHTESTNLDSFHDLLKKLRQGLAWAPLDLNGERTYAGQLVTAFADDSFTWLSAVVGQSKGLSLRDLAVHRSALTLNTAIDGDDRGRILVDLDKDAVGDADRWMVTIYEEALRFVYHVRADIEALEVVIASAGGPT
jgi:hypothetical protein